MAATTYTYGAVGELVEITREGTGEYCASVFFDVHGKWRLQYQTTGPDAVKETTVRVERQRTRS
jgi:hypothetical protein